jgi:hypothetical protein
VIQGYDQEAWAVLLRYNLRDHTPALELFRAVRATTAQLLPELNDEDWQRAGWHTEHGLYTPAMWLQIYAVHAHNHAARSRASRRRSRSRSDAVREAAAVRRSRAARAAGTR